MGYAGHLLPPDFYLSHPGRGLILEFTDVQSLTDSYSSSPNVQPMMGMTAPFVSEGSGNGLSWSIEANLNPFHGFLIGGSEAAAVRQNEPGAINEGASTRRSGTPYDELVQLRQLIEEEGPSPLLVMHRPKLPDVTVALTALDSTVFLQESVRGEDREPTIIPLSFTLIERRSYKVTVF